EEEANIALVAEWDDVQAMMDADNELGERLQAEEQGELTIEERSKLFVKLMNQRKKHFARLRAEDKRRKPPTKAQKRNQMCTYLKNMAGFTHNQLKNKIFDKVQKAFDKTMREELESDKSKKQKLDEKVEAKVDNDQEEAKMKIYMMIVSDDEVAIDAIPLASKPPIIVNWKIIKEGKISSYHIIRADRSSKRPEEAYERVLWDDLKVMFEPDIESKVWRELQGNKVTVWKPFSSCGVHFMRFQNLHIFMLVEKRYFKFNKSSSPADNSTPNDTIPAANTPTLIVTAKENNTDNQSKIQIDNTHVDDNEFYNIFSTLHFVPAALTQQHHPAAST
nr:hypothetical protein [Tanacetum cinerariifolium]